MKLPKTNVATLIAKLLFGVNLGLMLIVRYGYDFSDYVPVSAAMMGWVSAAGAWGCVWAIFQYGSGKESAVEKREAEEVCITLDTPGKRMYLGYPVAGHTDEYSVSWINGAPVIKFVKRVRSR